MFHKCLHLVIVLVQVEVLVDHDVIPVPKLCPMTFQPTNTNPPSSMYLATGPV